MNISIEEISKIKRKMTVELPPADAAKVREKHLNKLVSQASIKGFRPGKAPKSLVAKIYAEHLISTVTEELISEYMPKAMEEKALNPVGLPALEKIDNDENRFAFEVSFEIMPVLEEIKWQGLALNKEKYQVTDEMIDKNLDDVRQKLSTLKNVEEDRELLPEGDVAEISYQGYDEAGNELDSLRSPNFTVEMGTNHAPTEFEKNLPGMKKGEVRETEISFPASIQDKKVAGKTLKVKATLHGIKVRELPALDDELAKDLGLENVDTLDALKNKIREDLTSELEKKAAKGMNKQLTDLLAEMISDEVPEALVEQETKTMVASLKADFQRNGIQLGQLGMDEARLAEDYRPKAVVAVKAALVLEKIAKDNNIETSDSDLEAEYEKLAKEYGQEKSVIKDFHEKNKLVDNLRHAVKVARTLELIKEAAQITEVEPKAPAEAAALETSEA